MNDTTIYVGLDVHKYAIDRLLKKLPGRPKLVYEAGPCGFRLHRHLTRKAWIAGAPPAP